MSWTRKKDSGYYVKMIGGVLVYRHRWVWEQTHGPIPAGMTIDHINGVPGDDDLQNLQIVNNSDNNRLGSHKLKSSNTCGYNCVSRNHIGKWTGSFRFGGKRVHCGSHATPEQANAAVLAKREELNAPTRRMATPCAEAVDRHEDAGTARTRAPLKHDDCKREGQVVGVL